MIHTPEELGGKTCSKCKKSAILEQKYSGRNLCVTHCMADIESRAKHELRRHNWLSSHDSIAVGLSGCAVSAAVLAFLHTLTRCRRDITLCAIHLSRESSKESDQNRKNAITVAEQTDVPLIIEPFSLDFLSDQLDLVAKKRGITKVAYGYHLEDLSSKILAEVILGDVSSLLYGDDRIDRSHIAPFRIIPQKEALLYAKAKYPDITWSLTDFKDDAARALDTYSCKHPSVHHAIIGLCDRIAQTKQHAEFSRIDR